MGMAWSRSQSWSLAVDNVASAIERVIAKRQTTAQSVPSVNTLPPQTMPPMPVHSVDGLVQPTETVQLVETAV